MIVITAPTSKIGHRVVDTILDSDRVRSGMETVRLIVRDPARLPSQVRERTEVVTGSHNDPEILDEALTGADTVFWLVPPDPSADSVESHYLSFTEPFCTAIADRGVRRVVDITTLGHGYDGNAGNLSAGMMMDDRIEATGVAFRALCMPFFMENLLGQAAAINGGVVSLANAGDRVLRTVATRDIAPTASRLLLDESWSGQDKIPVIGPDELTPHDMAKVISEVLDRPVRFQHLAAEDFTAMMTRYGATDGWAQSMVDMASAQDQGIYRDAQRIPEAAPTSFRQWCQDELEPAVRAAAT